MNKSDLTKKLKTGKILTEDEQLFLINLVNTKKKYGLVWEEKVEDVEEELRTKLPVFTEAKERSLVNGTENPNHILIEGDNLHALTALTFTHEGCVDLIYIDPPYNRGENDFKYNDNYIQKDDPFKHSFWLNFISKRLRLAKRLLKESGVIVIHIDEHEFDALNLLLETEIFGEENSLGQIIYNKQNPKGDAKTVATMHEYLLIYCKNKTEFLKLDKPLTRKKPNAVAILNKAKRLFAKIGKVDIPEEIREIVKVFNYPKDILQDFEVNYDLDLVNKEFRAWLNRQDFSGGEKAYKYIDENGKVYRGVSMAWPNKQEAPADYKTPLIHPKTGLPCPMPARGWRNPTATMQRLLESNLILFGKDEKKQPERKYFLEENLLENTPSIYNNAASNDNLFRDLGISFPYPKPVEVAKYFLQSIHPSAHVILDFFAGSGTTLHATMELNAEDGMNRQCILITNNENQICEEVTYVRNKKIIEGYYDAKNRFVAGLLKNNLRYFKSTYVDRVRDYIHKQTLTRMATEMLCIKHNCYQYLTSELSPRADFRLFTDQGEKYMCVVYDVGAIDAAIHQINRLINTNQIRNVIKVYVFSESQYPYNEKFSAILEWVELCALPDLIYKAYQSILPSKKTIPILELDQSVQED